MFAFDTEVDRSSNKLSLTDHIILSTFDFGYVQLTSWGTGKNGK